MNLTKNQVIEYLENQVKIKSEKLSSDTDVDHTHLYHQVKTLINTVKILQEANNSIYEDLNLENFSVYKDGICHNISIKNILWIESDNQHCIIRTINSEYRVRKSIEELCLLLRKYGIEQIHRCYLINLKKLTGYKPNESRAIMVNGSEIPISRNHMKKFKAATL